MKAIGKYKQMIINGFNMNHQKIIVSRNSHFDLIFIRKKFITIIQN
jgi:hypothetical protein